MCYVMADKMANSVEMTEEQEADSIAPHLFAFKSRKSGKKNVISRMFHAFSTPLLRQIEKISLLPIFFMQDSVLGRFHLFTDKNACSIRY